MRARIWVALLGAFLLAAVSPAAGQAALEIDTVDAGRHPSVSFLVTASSELVGQDLPPEAFVVLENEVEQAADVSALPVDDLDVVLLVDTSGSMRGEPMDAARSAAVEFLSRMPAGVNVSVVGFGSQPDVITPFTTDAAAAVAGVQILEASGETALYDAVLMAVQQFPAERRTRRVVVLLSDGGDTVSGASLVAAIERIAADGVSLYAVALETAESDLEALGHLAQAGEAGALVAIDDPAALAGAYSTIAAKLVHRYRVSYESGTYGRAEVTIRVQHEGRAAEVSRDVVLPPAPALPANLPEEPRVRAGELLDPGMLARPWVLVAGAAAFFVGVAFVLAMLLMPASRTVTAEQLGGGARGERSSRTAPEAVGSLAAAAERMLVRRQWLPLLGRSLERAGVALRPGEFVVLVGLMGIVVFAIAILLLHPLVAAALSLGCVVGARLYLRAKAGQRRMAFNDQFPDTLQLLAGSLRAGYGLLQALDAVAQESEAPTSDEFRRMLVETRLGRGVTDAMESMAARVQTEDFDWVVQAIDIHRDVGGDLAEVLDNVAATVRERAQIKQQIKVLSAEGRLSAWVLLALPVFMAVMLTFIQPGYINELFSHPLGIVMLAAGVLLLLVGAVWIRRLVKIVF